LGSKIVEEEAGIYDILGEELSDMGMHMSGLCLPKSRDKDALQTYQNANELHGQLEYGEIGRGRKEWID
jgi:hypothetical protein